MKVTGNPVRTNVLITTLRLIASGKGKPPSNFREICGVAADRLEDLDERVAIMMEGNNMNTTKEIFNAFNDNSMYGGGAGEEH